MDKESIAAIIDDIEDGNLTDSEKLFQSLIDDRISDMIDTMKANKATELFNSMAPTDDNTE
jgi:Mg/Co/Ni transporter MgtE